MTDSDRSNSSSISNVVWLRPRSASSVSPSAVPPSDEGELPVDDDRANEVSETECAQRDAEPEHVAQRGVVPVIHLDDDFHRIVEQAMQALSANPLVFAKGDQLVRLALDGGAPRLLPLGTAQLRELLSAGAQWRRDEPVHPPSSVATALIKRGTWSHIRELRALTTFPVLSATGELRTEEGYEKTTRTFFHAGGCAVRVPETPSVEDAKAAGARLLDLVADFPFAGDAHMSGWLAALLTPLARFMHEGNAPLVVIQANMPGSGKTTLAQIIASIVTGATIPVMACEKGEPNRKEILAKLRASPSLALIDNVAQRFGGPNMATLITSRCFEDRSLGHLKTLSAPNDTTWIVTGNRITLAPDMARRCLHVRLQCHEEKPHERTGFRQPNLMQYVREHRAVLLSDALTILKGYAVAESPEVGLEPWGSFEDWSRIIRGALVWCGLADPAATRSELEEEAEESVTEQARWVLGWEELQLAMARPEGITVKEALTFLCADRGAVPRLRELIDALPRRSAQPDPLHVARRLREAKDRNLNGRMLHSAGNPKEALVWTVRQVDRKC